MALKSVVPQDSCVQRPRRRRLIYMKIGFLFNHDQTHQVAHSLPIALELIQNHPDVDVVVATTNSKLSEEVRHLGAQAGMAVPLVQLGLKSGAIQMASRVLEPILPLGK